MTDAAPPEMRSERETRSCRYCGTDLPAKARQNREYCSAHCRRAAFGREMAKGKVRAVRVLKSGDYSVTYHIRQTHRKPGDIISEG